MVRPYMYTTRAYAFKFSWSCIRAGHAVRVAEPAVDPFVAPAATAAPVAAVDPVPPVDTPLSPRPATAMGTTVTLGPSPADIPDEASPPEVARQVEEAASSSFAATLTIYTVALLLLAVLL